ncbi:MAG: hypothetical protein ABH879_10420 [archaeon]
MRLENVLDVHAGYAAVLHPTGEYTLYHARPEGMFSENGGVVNTDDGVRNLRAPGVHLGSAVIFENGYSVLVHALTPDNLRRLLFAIGVEAPEVHLCTPNAQAGYGDVVREIMPGTQVIPHHKPGPYPVEQNPVIGMDVLNFDDGSPMLLRS